MLGRRRRRQANIESTLGYRIGLILNRNWFDVAYRHRVYRVGSVANTSPGLRR